MPKNVALPNNTARTLTRVLLFKECMRDRNFVDEINMDSTNSFFFVKKVLLLLIVKFNGPPLNRPIGRTTFYLQNINFSAQRLEDHIFAHISLIKQ